MYTCILQHVYIGFPICIAPNCMYNPNVMKDAKYQLPPEKRHYKKTYSMTYDVVEFLRTRYNKSATVDQSVRASKEFRAWQREQKGGVQTQQI